MSIQVVILAAGQGKRMYSNLPKVLHSLAGKALLEHVIDTALALSPSQPPIVIYGYEGDRVRDALAHCPIQWMMQKEQLGTGHALLQALPEINKKNHILVLYGDVPLITLATLKKFIKHTPNNAIGILTAHLKEPTGYGRIIRDVNNNVSGIVEEKDATPEERAINEINSGIYYVPGEYLHEWLPNINNDNAQKEYYLTGIIPQALQQHITIHTEHPIFIEEIMGVNDRAQLAKLERLYQRRFADRLLQQGVTLADPARFDIRGEANIGQDVFIDINVIFEGKVSIGDGCIIGPNVVIRNAKLGELVEVRANSVIEEADIASGCLIGPFARIRPGTTLATQVHIGNFVEVKNSKVNAGTKINHLSYIGDATLGKRVNIGAGTITCNYDGVDKHRTVIGDDVQIGSDTQLVAPVAIGDGATIGAGATVIHDVPAYQLTVTHRLDQRVINEWQRPVKKSESEV